MPIIDGSEARQRDRSAIAEIGVSDVAGFIDGIVSHGLRLVVGLDAEGLADRVALERSVTRPILAVDFRRAVTVAGFIETAIAQLARAVSGLWPFLWNGEDFSELRDDALSRAHLPIRLAELGRRLPRLSQTWARAIVPQLQNGRVPRLDAPLDLEWSQLVFAFSPDGLIIATPLQSPDVAEAQARALEWLAQRADVSFLVLADAMPADPIPARFLFDARAMSYPDGDTSRERAADATADPGAIDEVPVVVALPPAPEGRPHPMSPIEQKLYALIQAEDELRPLFAFNKTVPSLPLLQARADILWLDGRVVVEIDGPEHRAAAKFRADRHRDYELMCAGFRVLRITNDDVAADAALAVEKIRTVVRLCQGERR